MAEITFEGCTIDVEQSDIASPEHAAQILMNHYNTVPVDRDDDGNATITGKHISITGRNGHYHVQEVVAH